MNAVQRRAAGRAVSTRGAILLVPADVLVPRRPDEMFAAEAAAARQAGIPVAVVDHDAITQSGDARQAVARVPEGHPDAVYRGWMVRAATVRGARRGAGRARDGAAHHARAVPARRTSFPAGT